MIERLAADLLVSVHLGFILFVALGGFLVLKWGKVAFLHIPCALWGALIEFGGCVCPLTPLEQHFRKIAGEAGYTGGFIDHYVMLLIYPAGLTRGMQVSLGVVVLAVNLCVYGRGLVDRANRRKDRAV